MLLRPLEGLALEDGKVDPHHLPAARGLFSVRFFGMRFLRAHLHAFPLTYVREKLTLRLEHRGQEAS